MTYAERIEAIALAIEDVVRRECVAWSVKNGVTYDAKFSDWKSYRDHAIAADAACIKALEEPTPGMCEHAQYTEDLGAYKDNPEASMVRSIGKRHAELVWHAMHSKIDRGET